MLSKLLRQICNHIHFSFKFIFSQFILSEQWQSPTLPKNLAGGLVFLLLVHCKSYPTVYFPPTNLTKIVPAAWEHKQSPRQLPWPLCTSCARTLPYSCSMVECIATSCASSASMVCVSKSHVGQLYHGSMLVRMCSFALSLSVNHKISNIRILASTFFLSNCSYSTLRAALFLSYFRQFHPHLVHLHMTSLI